MKPIELKMKAFGSYAKPTTIRFADLDPGLYLITGDTGAGKTTIFDAMVFALYGEASGSSRIASMLHSDYVEKSEDTIVELTFEHNFKQYKVIRKLHCAKKRDGSYDDPKQSAIFYEPDKLPVEVSSKVTNRIIEIIGLDANQFRQIIVLAQGEFQKFLKADGRQRNEILGKLFDNTPYLSFQARLKKASEKISKMINDDYNAINIIMNNFIYPNGDRLLYNSSNPDFINNISLLVEDEKRLSVDLKHKIADVLKEKGSLEAKKANIITNNELISNLASLKKKDNLLQEQSAYYAKLNDKIIDIEKVNSIYPYELAYKKAILNCKKNNDLLSSNHKMLSDANLKLTEANNKFNGINRLNNDLLRITKKKDELEGVISKFIPFHEAQKTLTIYNKKLNDLILIIDNDNKLVVNIQQTIKNNKHKQSELNKTIELLPQNTIDYKISLDKYHKIFDDNCLYSKVQQVNDMQNNILASLNKELEIATKAQNMKHNYDHLYNQFIRFQASILAKELKIKLETNKKVICPVCKHELSINDINNLTLVDDVVDQDILAKAKKDFEDLEQERSKLHNQNELLNAQKVNLIKNIMEISDDCSLDITNINELTMDYFESLKTTLSQELAYKKEIVDACYIAKQTYEKIDKDNLKLEKQIEDTNLKLTKANNQFISLKSQIANQESIINGYLESLKGYSEIQIKTEIKQLDQDIITLEKTIDTITKNKLQYESKVNQLKGVQETLIANNAKYEEETNDSLKLFNQMLKKNNLELDKYYQLFTYTDNREEWLKVNRQKYNDYHTELKAISDLIMKYEKLCENIVYTDIKTIEEEIMILTSKYSHLNDAKDNNQALLNNHEGILKELVKRQLSINKYLPANNRLKKLSDLANGYNTEGGKLSFDRFAMGTAFREILNAANVHLHIMTGGQYELLHQTKSDNKAATAGLDIEILDNFTKEKRKPDTLSGGEQFQVSLALALGLSDVVQNHTGGIKVETMYIDEGFGSLDEAILDKAMQVLNDIANDKRQIGIISHVSCLQESIAQKIIVKKGSHGSYLTIQK